MKKRKELVTPTAGGLIHIRLPATIYLPALLQSPSIFGSMRGNCHSISVKPSKGLLRSFLLFLRFVHSWSKICSSQTHLCTTHTECKRVHLKLQQATGNPIWQQDATVWTIAEICKVQDNEEFMGCVRFPPECHVTVTGWGWRRARNSPSDIKFKFNHCCVRKTWSLCIFILINDVRCRGLDTCHHAVLHSSG